MIANTGSSGTVAARIGRAGHAAPRSTSASLWLFDDVGGGFINRQIGGGAPCLGQAALAA
jgi:hypothetical protein